MERLTERNRNGIAFSRIPLNASRLLDVEYCYTGFIADRLAEYEDTGLMPEEVDILETQLEQAQAKVKELEGVLGRGTDKLLERIDQLTADNAALMETVKECYSRAMWEYHREMPAQGSKNTFLGLKKIVDSPRPGAALLERLQQALELAKVPVCQKCDHAKQYTQGVVLGSWCEFNRRRINPYLEKAPTWCPLREEATDEASDKV